MRCAPVIVLLLALLTLSCASTTIAPFTDQGPVRLEDDEQRLWNRAAEQAKAINESGFLYPDKALEEYVNAVAKKLQPPEVYAVVPFAIRVIKSPYLNAFALPNGAVYIHTGILAAMENEAQLAALLGHEMTHTTHRHGVKGMRDRKNKSAVLSSITAATGGLGMVFGPVALASAYGYSRDLEREADQEGFRLQVKAGYDPAEAVKVFELIKREIEEEKTPEPFFFGTHPRVVERIEHYRELQASLREGVSGTVRNEEAYESHIRRLIPENARLNIAQGRCEKAESDLQRYAAQYPGDAEAHYLLGEAYRKQGDDHAKKAEDSYQRALSLDANHPEAHKMLGLLLFKRGDKAHAREQLEKYLVLNAKAPDRAYVEDYIRRCDEPARAD